jgi:hypothetical protein
MPHLNINGARLPSTQRIDGGVDKPPGPVRATLTSRQQVIKRSFAFSTQRFPPRKTGF